MSKKTFKVIKYERSTQYIFVNADSAEDAMELARENYDSVHWRESQDLEGDIESAVPVTDEDVLGKIIDIP